MSQIDIQPVRTRRQRKDFLELPYRLNASLPLWVPPLRSEQARVLDPRKNPFYDHAEAAWFVAYRAGHPAGRIVAIENRRHNQVWNDRVGFFGHYEAEDDCRVSRGLFAAAAGWLRERGLDRLRGPTNPSMNDNAGFLIDGFEYPPSIPMPYTPAYYVRQADDFGMARVQQLVVYGWNYGRYTQQHIDTTRRRIQRLTQYVQQKYGIVVRGPRRDRIDEELEAIRQICNESLRDNWGFVPLTGGQMRAARRELEQIIDPDMFFIAEIEGRPEAVFLACPDYNEVLARMNGRLLPWGWLTYLRYRKRIRKYVVYVYATTPRAEAMGVGPTLYQRYFTGCFSKGIRDGETGYVLEQNRRMRNSIEKLGAELRKRYQIFEKALSS